MRIVDHGESVVFFGKFDNSLSGPRSFRHRETAVGCNQTKPRVLRGAQLRFEIGHIAVSVTEPLRFAEPDAVDNAGVIQFVADHRVLVVSSVSNNPPLASKHDGKEWSPRSREFCPARPRVVCECLVSTNETTLAIPKPCVSSASFAAAMSAG